MKDGQPDHKPLSYILLSTFGMLWINRKYEEQSSKRISTTYQRVTSVPQATLKANIVPKANQCDNIFC